MAGIADLLAGYLARGLVDFRGLEIVGTIPVTDDVLNELIRSLLQQRMSAASPAAEEPVAKESPVPLNELLKLIKRAEIEAHEGRVIVHVELGVDGQHDDRP